MANTKSSFCSEKVLSKTTKPVNPPHIYCSQESYVLKKGPGGREDKLSVDFCPGGKKPMVKTRGSLCSEKVLSKTTKPENPPHIYCSQKESAQNKTLKPTNFLLPCEHDHTYAKKKLGETVVKKKSQKRNMHKKVAMENSKHKKPVAKTETNLGHKANLKNLKFYTLNVGGLKTKMNFEDFYEEITAFDIVCLLEIKLDKNDISVFEKEFEQFKVFTNVEEEYLINPRGGIMILVKN